MPRARALSAHARDPKRWIERSSANGSRIILQNIDCFEAARRLCQWLDGATDHVERWAYTLQPFLVRRGSRQKYSTDLDFPTGSIRRKIPAADRSKELSRVVIKAPQQPVSQMLALCDHILLAPSTMHFRPPDSRRSGSRRTGALFRHQCAPRRASSTNSESLQSGHSTTVLLSGKRLPLLQFAADKFRI
jgi:hypothetical protein